ncbi:MAG TPA: hypothetical protein VN716_19400 [Vicinamibacterales bacterium]|nr:hypothetical protein [Vicinamibacterales bacterium]
MKNYAFAIVVAVALAAAGCVGFEHKSTVTGPTNGTATINALMGTWASASSGVIPSPSTCVDFKWNPTEQSATSAKGSFSATCAGGLKVAGTASGTLSGSTITWGANGTATETGGSPCAITLTGTDELGTNSIRIPYTGSTCVGPVSGVEILNKK